MGEDIDEAACREVIDYLRSCPSCRVYYDTVKKTVHLCRQSSIEVHMPEDVNIRLLKVLQIEEYCK
jgi:predicted anti-sigma-YlaC factor YlaD